MTDEIKPDQLSADRDYRVTVHRTGYGFAEFSIRCKPDELNEKALQRAADHVFSEMSSDYDLLDVDEVDGKTGEILKSWGPRETKS